FPRVLAVPVGRHLPRLEVVQRFGAVVCVGPTRGAAGGFTRRAELVDWRERLLAYLCARLPSADRLELVRISGMPAGASNDTVAFDLRITCDEAVTDVALVLRPQRPDGILAPYDVGRQFAIMRALKQMAVPVPTVAWYEADSAVLGVPFFLMERVHGDT